jgi:hypothetical protein
LSVKAPIEKEKCTTLCAACAQQTVYAPAPGVPPVTSSGATSKVSSAPAASTVAEVVAERPAKVIAVATAVPQALEESPVMDHCIALPMMRTAFVDARPTPRSCRVQASVSVQPRSPRVNGPEIWKAPTSKVGFSAKAQQRMKSARGRPAVGVPKLKTRQLSQTPWEIEPTTALVQDM